MRVLSLSDREVQGDRRRPASWPVHAVVVLRSRGKLGGNFSGKVDAGPASEAPRVPVLEQRCHAEFDAELIEVDVAALRDRFGERQIAVPARVPAPEVAVAVLEPAAAWNGHMTPRAHDAALQPHRRDRQLPRRSWWIARLDRAIEERVRGTLTDGAPVRRRDTADERIGIEARRAVEGEDLAGVGIEREDRAALTGREDLRDELLQAEIDRRVEIGARHRIEVGGRLRIAHHLTFRTHFDEPHAFRAAQRVVVLALQPILAD